MLSCCQTELNTKAKSSGKDEIFKNLEEINNKNTILKMIILISLQRQLI
jgi:hypothetical protein